MASIPLWTYHDFVTYLLDSSGGSTDDRANVLARMAVQTAFRELLGICNWSYLFRNYRVVTEDLYDTGTITYDHTGGASERLVTLASGTFPTWAARGEIYIASIPYKVETRESSTTLTLSVETNPGEDVAAGTSYSLVRSRYTLPVDFRAAWRPREMLSVYGLEYVEPSEMALLKQSLETSGEPRYCSIINDPDYIGAYALEFYPPPSTGRTHELPYQRLPRQMSLLEYTTGTVTASQGSATVTGNSTVWTDKMVGSVIRFGDTTNIPDGIAGLNPAVEERIITARASATSITVDSVLDNAYTTVKYRISDPVDIEDGTMLDAMLTACEAKFARARRDDKILGHAEAAYQKAVRLAKAADSRKLADIISGPLSQLNYGPVDQVDWDSFELA